MRFNYKESWCWKWIEYVEAKKKFANSNDSYSQNGSCNDWKNSIHQYMLSSHNNRLSKFDYVNKIQKKNSYPTCSMNLRIILCSGQHQLIQVHFKQFLSPVKNNNPTRNKKSIECTNLCFILFVFVLFLFFYA